MKPDNKYQRLTPNQPDLQPQLTIGNAIWLKSLLEFFGGFANGYIIRMIFMTIGVFAGISLLLNPGTLIPLIILGVSTVVGFLLGSFYAGDQYRKDVKKNQEELNLLIKNQDLRNTARQLKEIMYLSKDDIIKLQRDKRDYDKALWNYILERKHAEIVNKQLRIEISQLEQCYLRLTGNSTLNSYPALEFENGWHTPHYTHFTLPAKPQPAPQKSFWEKTKLFLAAAKQGINYGGVPAGVALTIATTIAASSTIAGVLPLAAAIAIISGIFALSAAVAGLAMFYYLKYENPQEEKITFLKDSNRYLKAKYNLRQNELSNKLNQLYYQNNLLKMRAEELNYKLKQLREQPARNPIPGAQGNKQNNQRVDNQLEFNPGFFPAENKRTTEIMSNIKPGDTRRIGHRHIESFS